LVHWRSLTAVGALPPPCMEIQRLRPSAGRRRRCEPSSAGCGCRGEGFGVELLGRSSANGEAGQPARRGAALSRARDSSRVRAACRTGASAGLCYRGRTGEPGFEGGKGRRHGFQLAPDGVERGFTLGEWAERELAVSPPTVNRSGLRCRVSGRDEPVVEISGAGLGHRLGDGSARRFEWRRHGPRCGCRRVDRRGASRGRIGRSSRPPRLRAWHSGR
jgi:hypothetical protein